MSVIELVRVSTPEDWEQYHNIREKVLFENKNRPYDRMHVDEHLPNNTPFLLKKDGLGIATTRLDLRPDTQAAIIRLVAVVESEQRKGYGRTLQEKIEEYAHSQGVKRLLVNAAPDAIGFYEKIGFVPESWDPEELTGISKDSVQLSKAI